MNIDLVFLVMVGWGFTFVYVVGAVWILVGFVDGLLNSHGGWENGGFYDLNMSVLFCVVLGFDFYG